jgi:hypothetical protein
MKQVLWLIGVSLVLAALAKGPFREDSSNVDSGTRGEATGMQMSLHVNGKTMGGAVWFDAEGKARNFDYSPTT